MKQRDTAEIASIQGSGCIKHIWMTAMCKDKYFLRKIVLEMYWDGEDIPSVQAPLGDFFGVGHGYCKHCVSLPMNMVFAKDRRGPKGTVSAAFNCHFPMPFNVDAKIRTINEADADIDNLFFMVDYELYEEPLPENYGYFHAQFRHDNPCKKVEYPKNDMRPAVSDLPGKNLDGKDNYVILDANGRGHYIGCVLNIDNRQFHTMGS